MSKTEDIEAKLAAYIDGELDVAQRAEIEKHLAEHPKHRTLIQELMGQKDLLKTLPRQAAPADLAEAFTAQLERAVLLGDVDSSEPREPMRIGFFQQFAGIAAMLLLTVGLAAVIYQLLPRRVRGDSPLADLRMAPMDPGLGVTLDTSPRAEAVPEARSQTPPESDPMGPVAISLAPTAPSPVSIPEIAPEPDIFAPPTTQPGLVDPAPIALADSNVRDLSGAPTVPLVDQANRNPDTSFFNGGIGSDLVFRQMVAEHQLRAASAGTKDQTVVVRAGDPDRANLEVVRYLDTNNIRWENQVEPMPEPIRSNEAQDAMGSRLQTANVVVKNTQPAEGGARGGRGGGVQQQLLSNNRIVARQVSQQQAQQLVADMNALQSKLNVKGEEAAAVTVPSNSIELAQNLNRPAPAAPGSLPPPVISNFPSIAPAPAAPPIRLLPVDPSVFLSFRREPLSLNVSSVPTQQPAAPPVPDGPVDVVIVIEPETTPTPATLPGNAVPQ